MDLIPLIEAAALAKVSTNTIRNYQQSGKLAEYKRGGRIFVDRTELMAIFTTVRVSSRADGPTRIFAISNQKGGTGKSTTAVNLGYLLSQRAPTLLIDADPQANLTLTFGVDPERMETTLYEVMVDRLPLTKAILHLPPPYEGVDLVPSNLVLAGTLTRVFGRLGWERLLATALGPVKQNYEYVVIDCPPNLDVLTINALMAATDVIVPVEMGTYSLRGTADLLKVIQEVALTNPMIGSPRFLANRLENTRVSATIQEQLKRRYGDMVLCSTIRKASVVGASQINRRPIALEDPTSPASKDYEALVEELLNA